MKYMIAVVVLALAAVLVSGEQDLNAKRDKRGFLAAPAVAALAAPYAALPAPVAYAAPAPVVYAAAQYAAPYAAAPAPYAYYG